MSPQMIALARMYPQLATTVAGESPLAHAIDEYYAGRCATTITARDLAADAKIPSTK